MVVIYMENPNALMAVAYISQNDNNIYGVFCEYIKYCVSKNGYRQIVLKDVHDSIANEFGVELPHNVLLFCLRMISKEGFLEIFKDKSIKIVGNYDCSILEKTRNDFHIIENNLINSMVSYGAKFNKKWSHSDARELLIKILNKSGLACDIFLENEIDFDAFEEDYFNEETEDIIEHESDISRSEPLFKDAFIAGKFIEETLNNGSAEKEFLYEICKGMMICVGIFQLPDKNGKISVPNIKNTKFFFDTRLLLRFLGYAGEAAVEATKELVDLIQSNGGKVCYYPQTKVEMRRAIENAIKELENGEIPKDCEMQIYALKSNPESVITLLRIQNDQLEKDLSKSGIAESVNDSFTEQERLRFGFDNNDLEKFMLDNFGNSFWKAKAIRNDALALWETHMRRRGDYSCYYGGTNELSVFVTNNIALTRVPLMYKEERKSIKNISSWSSNKLPIITDTKLTCRLWSPSSQGAKLPLLHLTANAVAAQRPSSKYVEKMKQIACDLKEGNKDFSGLFIPSILDDKMTKRVLDITGGDENKLTIEAIANSFDEQRIQEKIRLKSKIKEVTKERDNKQNEVATLKKGIIDGAVKRNKNKLGTIRLTLYAILMFDYVLAAILALVPVVASYLNNNKFWLIATLVPVALAVINKIIANNFLATRILRYYFPELERRFERKIANNLFDNEKPYESEIVNEVKSKTMLWQKCQRKI